VFGIFKRYSNLIVVISGRKDGTMKLSGDLIKDKDTIENRKKFLKKLGIQEKATVIADLVHPVKFAPQLFNRVKVVSNADREKTIKEIDGLITADRNLFLTITVADCLPIFIYEPEKEIIGLIHAGWRNLAGNILREAVEKIKTNNLLFGIGPGIGQCHFEVKEDVIAKFKPYLKDTLLKRNGKSFLDLKGLAKIQLLNLGIKEENIEISPECTFCLKDKYFSFRRDVSPRQKFGSGDKPKNAKAMMAVIGMR